MMHSYLVLNSWIPFPVPAEKIRDRYGCGALVGHKEYRFPSEKSPCYSEEKN